MSSNVSIGKNATVENIVLTPKLARELDALNVDNRTKRIGFAEYLERLIRAGKWTLTNDCITILENGKLGNGQHRIDGVIRADMPVRVFLARNMPDVSYENTDVGIKRAQFDNLRMQKELVHDVKLIAFKMALNTGGRISNEHIREIADWYEPIFDTLRRVAGGDFRARGNNAGTRLGFGLRFAVGSRTERAYAIDQYAAFVRSDTTQMSRCIGAAWRRSVEDKEFTASRVGRFMLMNFLYHVSAYERRDKEPQLKHPKALDSETTQWFQMMADAYAAGPAKDGHPYVFANRPVVERELAGKAAQRHAERMERMAA
jgi:hypothetical protein